MTGTASRNEARKRRISESKMAITDSAAVVEMNKCQATYRAVRTRADFVFGLERGHAGEATHGEKSKEYLERAGCNEWFSKD